MSPTTPKTPAAEFQDHPIWETLDRIRAEREEQERRERKEREDRKLARIKPWWLND
jgi:hypothetical protein